MKGRTAALTLLTVLLALLCAACGKREDRFAPPPNLIGEWEPPSTESNYYQIATITDDEILLYWYTPAKKSKDLYWAGTFVPPTTGREPYKWTSVSTRDNHPEASRFTLVDETMEFTYKNGEIYYNVMMSHITAGMVLVRAEPAPPPEQPDTRTPPEQQTPPPAPPNQLP